MIELNKKRIKWFFLILWLIIIFLFSNQSHSGDTTHDIIKNLLPFIANDTILNQINFIIRKLAHITEYCILTLLLISLLQEYTLKEKTRMILSLLICCLYAMTDEYHQSFIPGRSAALKDVFIDTTGGVIALILNYLYQKRKNTKRK